MYVFDTTPLIYLGTVERLDLLKLLSRDCLVPGPVHYEAVVEGIERGYPDARRVERVVEEGLLEVRMVEETDLYTRLSENSNLSRADAAVLSLAKQVSGTAVMDERYGRSVADTEDIPTRGTAFLVISLLRDGELTASEARSIIDGLLDAGWYCSPDLYAKIVRKIESLPAETELNRTAR